MRTNDQHVMHSSTFCDWGTPRPMVDALRRHFDIALDVAASRWSAKAPIWFGPDHTVLSMRDGLAVSWYGLLADREIERRAVFMNPPYSRELGIPIEPWIQKAREESERLTVVGVVPASIQTRWWDEHVRNGASEIWEIPHRLDFEASDETLRALNIKRQVKRQKPIETAWNAGGNTAIVIWRPRHGFVGHVQPVHRCWTYRENANE